MKPFFLRGGLAFSTAMAAIGLGLCAEWAIDARHEVLASLVPFAPTFLVAVGLSVFLLLKTKDDPKLGPALGALLPLSCYALVTHGPPHPNIEHFLLPVLGVASLLGVGGLLGGLILERLPRVTIGLAAAMTLFAAIAVTLPSLPPSLWRGKTAPLDLAEVQSMRLVGVLVVDGAPVVARGITYRLQHNEWDATRCDVLVESSERMPAYVGYSCRDHAVRCDEERRMCLVEDDSYVTGYTYDGQAFSVFLSHRPNGLLSVRIGAWLLAIGAVVLLLRARTSPLGHALAMGALVDASISLGLMGQFSSLL